MSEQGVLRGKLIITGTLKLLTGLHIGAAKDFAPIGAVDSPFVRDPLTKEPVIPGSSLKGKLRTLLAKAEATGYVLNKIDDDSDLLKRLFGSAGKDSARPSRLQFYDLKMAEESVEKFNSLDLDTYIGEIKFENTISRLTAVANPRQIERVPAGAIFDFKLVYNIEKEDELKEDIQQLGTALQLLSDDYLGGHGSRGYGKVAFENLTVQDKFVKNKEAVDCSECENWLKGCR
ncbi:type III-A CRISPR-associated RAMP protein Csm3 [Anaeroglobus geminatus]|jgi:CRISPR-associated protein Csm3|uniref:CRISPR system Cms endoribonuclease Csm3 n=1 Tax=Anaeroglobus geminatus F0357 TaxID=861450 RepID=G9YKC9_9FIRM|nr:type III-A CRISPR-associated RAMP protein Csm3 [Anaeroglobus geminatus]EHM37600.1 CRISPR-associated RAMP protein, Csm3 family [Anaeroglobus geminatus F0357]